jgi:hypothetical protein
MRFISVNISDPKVIERSFNEYYNYLAYIKKQLPIQGYRFATVPWHYDPTDHKCPHDAWLETLIVGEKKSERPQQRNIEVQACFLGAYHDGYLKLVYKEVQSYSFDTPADFKLPPFNVGHGDWLIDEVRLSDRGFMLHEIEFSRGTKWLVECIDFDYEWIFK